MMPAVERKFLRDDDMVVAGVVDKGDRECVDAMNSVKVRIIASGNIFVAESSRFGEVVRTRWLLHFEVFC